MATLSAGGRITTELVDEETDRLRRGWVRADDGIALLTTVFSPEQIESIDVFDRFQLTGVLSVCRTAKSLSDAGRRLFAVSRQSKATANDADRLRKYLHRFGLAWSDVCA